jgi:hypothetical protein
MQDRESDPQFYGELYTTLESVIVVARDLSVSFQKLGDEHSNGIYLYSGGDRARALFLKALETAANAGEMSSPDLAISLHLGPKLDCETAVFTNGHTILRSVTYVSSFLPKVTQFYCATKSTLVALGFKGQITDIDQCDSVMCIDPKRSTPNELDITSLSLLYSSKIAPGMSGDDAAVAVRSILGR